jgi:hypothetical protein
MTRSKIIVAALTFSLCGCASIIDGSSEEVLVNTNPSGANCALNRQGETIARISPTPASATIKKTKYDITIVCDKDGYQEATFIDHSGIQSATWGNIVAGGLIGWGIDSASGADDHYDSPVNITLVPATAQQPSPSAASASPSSGTMTAKTAPVTPTK